MLLLSKFATDKQIHQQEEYNLQPIDCGVVKKWKRWKRKKHPIAFQRVPKKRAGGSSTTGVVAVIKSRKTDSVKQSHLS